MHLVRVAALVAVQRHDQEVGMRVDAGLGQDHTDDMGEVPVGLRLTLPVQLHEDAFAEIGDRAGGVQPWDAPPHAAIARM